MDSESKRPRGRPEGEKFPDKIYGRCEAGTLARLGAVLRGGETQAEAIRLAVSEFIRRRENRIRLIART